MRTSRATVCVKAFFALVLLLASAGCADRERITISEGDGQFALGPATEYAISETGELALPDTVTNATFAFPSGATGTLRVARILSSPIAPPDGADGFWVEFSTDDRLQIFLPREGNQEPLLWMCAIPKTSTYDGVSNEIVWLPVMPADTLSNPAVFDLYEEGTLPNGESTGLEKEPPAQSYYFMRRYVTRDGWEWQNMQNIQLATRWTMRDVIEMLPGALQGWALQETQDRLRLRAWVALASPNESAYAGFQYWARGLYRRTYPHFSFVATGPSRATEATIAHEVGHYMTHVFSGDDGFEDISEQLRPTHLFGDAHPERPMLEEYAMFVDYAKNGRIAGALNPLIPFTVLRTHHDEATPQNTDWPSMEGYPTCLLARLGAEGTTITGQSGGAEEIPSIDWSSTQLLGLLFGNKPSTANQLRAQIRIALEQQGEDDRLAPILERTGWSYHGHGTIVDDHGTPVAGAWVRSKCAVPSEGPDRIYYAPMAPAQTDGNGRFQLARIFPGASMLEIVVDDAASEFPIEVDPNRATTDEVDLGRFTIGSSLMQKLKTMRYVNVLCAGEFVLSNGGMETSLFGTGDATHNHPASWNGNRLTWDFADSSRFGDTVNGQRMQCTADFSADGHTLTQLTCHHYQWERFQTRLQHTRTSDMVVRNLPLDFHDTTTPGSSFANFDLRGQAIVPQVESISFVERYLDLHDITITATTFRWTGSTVPGWIEFSMRDSAK